MASCAYCGSTILFGGQTVGNMRFCNARCRSKGRVAQLAAQVSDGEARSLAIRIHGGLCPRCSSSGPVDVHTSYRVWSAVVLTQWQSLPMMACHSCGAKAQIGNLLFSAVLGWWGIPWGIILTPVQIGRNIAALSKPPNPAEPSPKLIHAARLQLAARMAAGGAAAAPAVRA